MLQDACAAEVCTVLRENAAVLTQQVPQSYTLWLCQVLAAITVQLLYMLWHGVIIFRLCTCCTNTCCVVTFLLHNISHCLGSTAWCFAFYGTPIGRLCQIAQDSHCRSAVDGDSVFTRVGNAQRHGSGAWYCSDFAHYSPGFTVHCLCWFNHHCSTIYICFAAHVSHEQTLLARPQVNGGR